MKMSLKHQSMISYTQKKMIIIIIIVLEKFFTPTLGDSFSLEFE